MDAKTPRIVEFDICGQICPASLIVALREINRHISQLNDGSVELLFKTDNRKGAYTIPDSANNMGFRAEVQKYERYYAISISRQ